MSIWRMPLVLAAISTFGLVIALVADGLGDVAGWISLAIPVLVICWFVTPAVQQRRLHKPRETP